MMKDVKIKGTDFSTDDVTSFVRFDSYDGMGIWLVPQDI